LIPAVYKAVETLVVADTTPVVGLVALLTGGYWAIETSANGSNGVPPYVVGSVQADVELDSFGGNGSTGYFTFNVYVPKYDSNNNAVSFGAATEAILSRLMTVFHNQNTTATFNGVTWRVFFKRSSGIAVPEKQFAWHHAETYMVTCFPST